MKLDKKTLMKKFAIWMAQIRASFLILSVLLVFVGISAVIVYNGVIEGVEIFHAVIIAIGVILAHMSVNLFNEYSDYNTKIDFNTKRTPFSGGSGMLTSGKTSPKSVLIAAILSLSVAFAIGLYFTIVSHWTILAISVFGLLTIVFYTTFLAKFMLGEIFSGLALGSLVVIGTYIAMTAKPDMPLIDIVPFPVILISIPSGVLTFLLLLLNEFPDVEADKKGGRYHIVIHFGKRIASFIYALGILLTFIIIAITPIAGYSSYWFLLALISLPIAVKAVSIAVVDYDNSEKITTAMGANVIIVLSTNLLIAIGLLL